MMQIEVESLKELEPGKTYALQLHGPISDKRCRGLTDGLAAITARYNIRFIIFTADLKLIDAPAEVGVT